MNQSRKWLLALVPISVLFALTIYLLTRLGGQENQSAQTETTLNTDAVASSNSSASSDNNTKITTETNQGSVTVSAYRCRGCGKCTMIDPEHFTMSGRTATVISQNNLSSAALTEAVDICPGQAITLG